MPQSPQSGDHAEEGRHAAQEQRKVQDQVAEADRRAPEEKSFAMQAGARTYPEPPFPEIHQAKPGLEADLPLKPMYDAPYYRGSGKLQDKVAIITGGDSGIGRAVAVLYAREGADLALLYLPDERVDAEETKRAVEDEGRRCLLIEGDVRDRAFCLTPPRGAITLSRNPARLRDLRRMAW